MVDLRTCKHGDKLLSKQGEILTYDFHEPGAYFPHHVRYANGSPGTRTDDGYVFRNKHLDADRDIVQIIGQEQEEEPKMTLKQCLEEVRDMWQWMADNNKRDSTDKHDYPPVKSGAMQRLSNCSACAYVATLGYTEQGNLKCKKCPLLALWTNNGQAPTQNAVCAYANTSPYRTFHLDLGTKADALRIVYFCERELKKLEPTEAKEEYLPVPQDLIRCEEKDLELTGETRIPKKGEYFLTAGVPIALRNSNEDFGMKRRILRVKEETVPEPTQEFLDYAAKHGCKIIGRGKIMGNLYVPEVFNSVSLPSLTKVGGVPREAPRQGNGFDSSVRWLLEKLPEPKRLDKPAQEWLDDNNLELTGEYRAPRYGEFFGPTLSIGDYECVLHTWDKNQPRWILRRKKVPEYIPWTLETLPKDPMPTLKAPTDFWRGYDGGLFSVVNANGSGVTLFVRKNSTDVVEGDRMTYQELFDHFTRVDGSPCGTKVMPT